MLITVEIPVGNLNIHFVSLSDIAARKQISKCQFPLCFSHWKEADIDKFPNRETKIGKNSLGKKTALQGKKKKSLHAQCNISCSCCL